MNNIKVLIVVFSYHHHNTEKIANAIAQFFDAQVAAPQGLDLSGIQNYDLIGFGSGIYDGKHHVSVLNLADKLPNGNGKKCFIFSTSGVPVAILGNKFLRSYMSRAHSKLKNKLESNGYKVLDEFICPGFNTNVFLKYFGGLNKNRPNQEDLENAKMFASKIKNFFI